jgi:two-component system chemotaxis response regulator CheY
MIQEEVLVGIPPDTKILVVDDMPTIRDLVKTQLRAMGFRKVVEAENGEQALLLLIENDSTADKVGFIVSDWNMPKMTGIEFLKHVRATDHWVNIPFILLTAESEREQVTEAVLAGVSQYVVKPFAGKAFEEKMNSAWSKHNKPK